MFHGHETRFTGTLHEYETHGHGYESWSEGTRAFFENSGNSRSAVIDFVRHL